MLKSDQRSSASSIREMDASGVAALILAMDRPDARRLLGRFEEDEIRTIVARASALGRIPTDRLASLIAAFESDLTKGTELHGSESEAERLVQEALPDDVAERVLAALHDTPMPVETWNRVTSLEARQVAEVITSEHPQIAAYILSRIEAEFAAAIVEQLDRDVRQELFDRMLDADATKDRPARLLEAHLSETLLSELPDVESRTIHQHAAGILNRLDRADADELLSSVSTMRPREGKILRTMFFSFEDILTLTAAARAKLFEGVPTERLVAALSDAAPELREASLEGLTSRTRRMVELELQSGTAASAKDADNARRWIADLAVGLALDGKIVIATDDGDDG